MNPNVPGHAVDLAARIELQRIPKPVVDRIIELAEGGLSDFEIHTQTGHPLPLIRLVRRGAGAAHR